MRRGRDPSTGGCGLPNRRIFWASSSIGTAFAGTPIGCTEPSMISRSSGAISSSSAATASSRSRVLRGPLHRATDGVGDLAAAACAGIRSAGGIGVDDAHALGVDAERLGSDRREAGLDAGHVGGPGDHRQAAIGVEAADSSGGLVPSRPPSEREPDALALGQVRPLLPQRMLPHALQTRAGAEHRERLSRRRLVAFDRDVQQSQLEWIDAEPLGKFVDQRLDSESSGRGGGRTIGAERDAVGCEAERRSAGARPSDRGRR